MILIIFLKINLLMLCFLMRTMGHHIHPNKSSLYCIVLKLKITYILYTPISHRGVSKCLCYNVTILCSNTILSTYLILLSALIELQKLLHCYFIVFKYNILSTYLIRFSAMAELRSVYVTMLLHCNEIQYKIRSLSVFSNVRVANCPIIMLLYCIHVQCNIPIYTAISHCYNVTILCSSTK